MDSKQLRMALQESAFDPSKSPIENALELTTLSDIGSDIFTNTRECWHAPSARGVFGGAVVAQSLTAAQATIPPPSPSNGNAAFLIHSMHCYFLLPGAPMIPILYHVERVREGRSFMTRTVQARQKGKCIFTTTCSFMRESEGQATIDHEWEIPEDAVNGLADMLKKDEDGDEIDWGQIKPTGSAPHVIKPLSIFNRFSKPHTKRICYWYRARGTITEAGGRNAHLGALAYMSDNYFIVTVPRVHSELSFSRPSVTAPRQKPIDSNKAITKGSNSPITLSQPKSSLLSSIPSPNTSKSNSENTSSSSPSSENATPQQHPSSIGMMVSLDHTIYFHRPRDIRADEWLCSEMESPWAGAERGLALQRIWNRDGRLLATCVQEGLVRLNQEYHGNGNANDENRGKHSKL